MVSESPKDLIVLVPGRDDRAALEGIFSNPQKIGIRPVNVEYLLHPNHDPGCRLQTRELLQNRTDQFLYALVLFDREGSGAEGKTREELERDVELQLENMGWGKRAAAVVVDPELEVWVWSDSNHVDRCLGWEGRRPKLREWLRNRGMWLPDVSKPTDPKDAMELAMKEVCKPRSSAAYKQLARSVGFQRCTDSAFLKLRGLLINWFPADSAG